MPIILIFLGVLGGALGFGFIGIFIGPTLLAVCYRLFKEWSTAHPIEVKPETENAPAPVKTM
jgi:predicted PurR-regulated permease PerM